MRIVTDCMGGDNAPGAAVRGALDARAEFGYEIVLAGDENKIRAEAGTLPSGVEILHAPGVVGMDDDPSRAIREKPDSSMFKGLKLVADGGADAFVSAGSTAALLTGATLIVKRIRGIRRGALVPMVPTAKGLAALIDGGANAETSAEYLLQFAYLGSAYAERAMGIKNPKVALLNNGTEPHKGPPHVREAHALIKAAGDAGRLNFIGNLEAREAVLGGADVIVADGFAGNVFLKTEEGVGMFFMKMMKGMFTSGIAGNLAALLVSGEIKKLRKKMDYAEYGGAPILGMSKPVIKAHGASNARAIRSAVKQAADYAAGGVTEYIASNIEFMKTGGEADAQAD